MREGIPPAYGRAIALDPPRANPDAFVIDVPLERGDQRVRLERAQVFAPDAVITVVCEQGRGANWAPLDLPIYRGTIEGDAGSVVAARLTDGGGLEMMLVRGDGERSFIEPRGAGGHVIYSAADLPAHDGACGVDQDDMVDLEDVGLARDDRMGGGEGQTLVAELAIDADYEYYQLFGSSTSAVMEDVAGLMAMVNVVYERDTGITHQISELIIRTSPNDPYTATDSGALLDEFVSHWRSNETNVPRDLAHLFTGRDLEGSVVGRAKVGVVCGSSAYAISQARFTTNMAIRIGVIAHELGHNWSASHCNDDPTCHIMCSAIRGCDGLGEPSFASGSASTIAGFADRLSCLGTEVIECLGDADGNLVIDFRDVTSILTRWGFDYGVGTGEGDADGNGVVNFEDITKVLAHWGDVCS